MTVCGTQIQRHKVSDNSLLLIEEKVGELREPG